MPDVASAAASGQRLETLESLVEALTTSIELAPTQSIPELARQLVDVLKRIGGTDPAVLVWMRDLLAPTIDRLVALQGEVDENGKPIPEAGALAAMVRQLVAVVDAIDALPAKSVEVSKVDELASRRRAKAGDPRSSARRRNA